MFLLFWVFLCFFEQSGSEGGVVHKKGLQLGTTTFGKEMHIRTTFLSFCGIKFCQKGGVLAQWPPN